MELDGPEEWHVAPEDGEARVADPSLDDDDLDDELWAAPPDSGSAARQGRSARGNSARGNAARRHVFGGNSHWATVVVAVAAAAVGVAVGLAFLRSPGPASSAAGPASSAAGPTASAIGPGGGDQQVQIIGTVTAVSRSSITIGGNGPSVTGTFTGSTRFSGSVSSAAGIKIGDQVAATLTGSPAALTVATIQDPAQ